MSDSSELERSKSVNNHWFRFDDEEMLDMKRPRTSDDIEDEGGRRTQLDDYQGDVNRTITRVSAGGILGDEDQWNFGVTVTKKVVVESLPRHQII